jgi:hypothetical protein
LPRAQQQRPQAWAPSSVRAVLYRDLYRGEVMWNATRKRDSWGRKKRQARAAEDWIHLSSPVLRIVSDDLWRTAHARLNESRTTYLRGTKGRLGGRPASGVESKYLLPGLAARH